MADFQFGQIGSALEAGRHANANINFGPVDTTPFSSLDVDFSDFVNQQNVIFKVQGSSTDFIWGNRWANRKTKVTA